MASSPRPFPMGGQLTRWATVDPFPCADPLTGSLADKDEMPDPTALLVGRRYVDLLRVASALCSGPVRSH